MICPDEPFDCANPLPHTEKGCLCSCGTLLVKHPDLPRIRWGRPQTVTGKRATDALVGRDTPAMVRSKAQQQWKSTGSLG